METEDFVRRVVIEFWDGHIQDITDSYAMKLFIEKKSKRSCFLDINNLRPQ